MTTMALEMNLRIVASPLLFDQVYLGDSDGQFYREKQTLEHLHRSFW